MEIISVVMTTYNGEKYIKEQIYSILNQSLPPNEIIISDDGSQDNTVKIMHDLLDDFKNISISIIENKITQGYIKNFKNTILKSHGDYIFLCDQDDIWEIDKIQNTLIKMKDTGAGIACTGFKIIDAMGNYISNLSQYKSSPICGYENWSTKVKDISLKVLIWGNFSPGCTYCFTKEIKNIYKNLTNTEISHDFQLLIIGASLNKAIYIDIPLSRYRLHGNNTIGINKKKAKYKRRWQPRLVNFLNELSKIQPVDHLLYSKVILYFRLSKIRAILNYKFSLNNDTRNKLKLLL